MGRIKSSITRIKEGKYLSKAMGMRDVIFLDFIFDHVPINYFKKFTD